MAGSWYDRDCLNALRAFVRVLMGAVVLEVKKFEDGRALWNVRTGAVLKADFDATTNVELSLKGWRSANAMVVVITS